MSAMLTETRAPTDMRVKRSRPKLSVPSQCSAVGVAKRLRMSIPSTE